MSDNGAPSAPLVILCADDFAMTKGVSDAIVTLAEQGRLSATSAMVTTPHWPTQAARLKPLAGRIGIGLHVNLTMGRPLGPMPNIAPSGRLPAMRPLVTQAVFQPATRVELTAEIERQVAAFIAVMGHVPDFIDGHQHVHVMPGIRGAFTAALRHAFPRGRIMIRDPSDRLSSIMMRKSAVDKAVTLKFLSGGLASSVHAAGFTTNVGFSGVSRFDTARPYAIELERFFIAPGPVHIAMCHPGHVDTELPALDPVTERRQQEFDAIAAAPWLPARIWRGDRATGAAAPAPSLETLFDRGAA